MNASLQTGLLYLYGAIRRSGFLDSGPGAWLYETAYDLYKARLEAGPVGRLRTFVKPGGWVVDVGAHIGFFSLRFARWVSEDGGVIACEPDRDNRERLCRRLLRKHLNQVVHVVDAAIGEADGRAKFVLCPDHPGNHHLANEGIDVPMRCIDSLVSEQQCSSVSLIKIDVQGSELRVIRGATRTLSQHRPALLVEIDPAAMKQSGTTPAELVQLLYELGYASFGPLPTVGESADSLDQALDRISKLGHEYADFLFTPIA
ncbi:MAG: FkbM family methyltransferase [Alphaproteobacteria bacterium]|nr:FkbM family methyltransferase [Alphaproteobacteria bacterium]